MSAGSDWSELAFAPCLTRTGASLVETQNPQIQYNGPALETSNQSSGGRLPLSGFATDIFEGNEDDAVSSPSTMSSSSPIATPWSGLCDSFSISSTTTPSSCPSSTFSTTSPPEVRCHSCSKTFKGSSGPTNLTRHLNTAKIHTDTVVPCLLDGCNATFNRNDNLKAHVQSVHKADMRYLRRDRKIQKRLMQTEDDNMLDVSEY